MTKGKNAQKKGSALIAVLFLTILAAGTVYMLQVLTVSGIRQQVLRYNVSKALTAAVGGLNAAEAQIWSWPGISSGKTKKIADYYVEDDNFNGSETIDDKTYKVLKWKEDDSSLAISKPDSVNYVVIRQIPGSGDADGYYWYDLVCEAEASDITRMVKRNLKIKIDMQDIIGADTDNEVFAHFSPTCMDIIYENSTVYGPIMNTGGAFFEIRDNCIFHGDLYAKSDDDNEFSMGSNNNFYGNVFGDDKTLKIEGSNNVFWEDVYIRGRNSTIGTNYVGAWDGSTGGNTFKKGLYIDGHRLRVSFDNTFGGPVHVYNGSLDEGDFEIVGPNNSFGGFVYAEAGFEIRGNGNTFGGNVHSNSTDSFDDLTISSNNVFYGTVHSNHEFEGYDAASGNIFNGYVTAADSGSWFGFNVADQTFNGTPAPGWEKGVGVNNLAGTFPDLPFWEDDYVFPITPEGIGWNSADVAAEFMPPQADIDAAVMLTDDDGEQKSNWDVKIVSGNPPTLYMAEGSGGAYAHVQSIVFTNEGAPGSKAGKMKVTLYDSFDETTSTYTLDLAGYPSGILVYNDTDTSVHGAMEVSGELNGKVNIVCPAQYVHILDDLVYQDADGNNAANWSSYPGHESTNDVWEENSSYAGNSGLEIVADLISILPDTPGSDIEVNAAFICYSINWGGDRDDPPGFGALHFFGSLMYKSFVFSENNFKRCVFAVDENLADTVPHFVSVQSNGGSSGPSYPTADYPIKRAGFQILK